MTLEWAVCVVNVQMAHQETFLPETLAAIFAVVDFFGVVHFYVHFERVFNCKFRRTVSALEGCNFSMKVFMLR